MFLSLALTFPHTKVKIQEKKEFLEVKHMITEILKNSRRIEKQSLGPLLEHKAKDKMRDNFREKMKQNPEDPISRKLKFQKENGGRIKQLF